MHLKIKAPFLLTLDDKNIIMMPDGCKFPYIKIKADIIIISHKSWKDEKYTILKNVLNKPKILFLD